MLPLWLTTPRRRIYNLAYRTNIIAISHLHTSLPLRNTQTKQAPISPISRLSDGLNTIKSTIFKLPQFIAPPTPKAVPFTGTATTWSQAVQEAQSLVIEPNGENTMIDPIALVARDLRDLKRNITSLLGSDHPLLNTVSKYYFSAEGKSIRPLLVLLISQATTITHEGKVSTQYDIIDRPISPSLAPSKQPPSTETERVFRYTPSVSSEGHFILPSQRRLAEIVEMIHTASLLHDDVIDNSEMRRNFPSANASFGNKMAILGGDFLLARASLALARLRNAEVTELMSTVIANLVEGEFMQLQNSREKGGLKPSMTTFEYYMEKTYMKTGSLIAQGCRAATVLGKTTEEVQNAAYTYGRNLGLAFQLIDDMLDFTVSSEQFGKPSSADLKLGLATAPVLYAWEEFPELGPLIERKFSEPGDVNKARELVLHSNGIEQTRALAEAHCQRAINAISQLPPSNARAALIQLTEKVLTRTK